MGVRNAPFKAIKESTLVFISPPSAPGIPAFTQGRTQLHPVLAPGSASERL